MSRGAGEPSIPSPFLITPESRPSLGPRVRQFGVGWRPKNCRATNQMSFPGRLLLSPRHFLRRSAPPAFSCPHSLRFHSSRSDHSTSSSVDQTTKTTPISSSTSSLQAPQEPSAEDAERPKPPPYLPRPLGVNDPPTTRPPTEQEKLAKLVDEQARLQERKHLLIKPPFISPSSYTYTYIKYRRPNCGIPITNT